MCRPYGWVFGLKFSKKGPLFHKHGWVTEKLVKRAKNGPFSTKIRHRSGYDSKFW